MEGNPAAYALSFEMGLRTLDQQLTTLRDTRDRSGRLLTAATFLVGLGGLAFRFDLAEEITAWGLVGGILALLGLFGVALATAAIWRPAGETVEATASSKCGLV